MNAQRRRPHPHEHAVGDGGGRARSARCSRGRQRHDNGVTCGAGMPYKIAEICARYGVHYYPIISSARAFRALWKRAYHKFRDWLGGVVYEDPWLAGGHNGLSNSEDPQKPEAPYPRVRELRELMREFGLAADADHHGRRRLVSARMGRLARQSRARPDRLPIRHAAAADAGKPDLGGLEAKTADLERGRCLSQSFLPDRLLFLGGAQRVLTNCSERSRTAGRLRGRAGRRSFGAVRVGARGRAVYLTPHDRSRAQGWIAQGFTEALRTPDTTLIFVTPQKAHEIRTDQIACMGCLSACQFSNWSQNEAGTTGTQGRSAQLLHSEDTAGDQPCRRCRKSADVRRPQRLSFRLGPVLRQRLYALRARAGGAFANRRLIFRPSKRVSWKSAERLIGAVKFIQFGIFLIC